MHIVNDFVQNKNNTSWI